MLEAKQCSMLGHLLTLSTLTATLMCYSKLNLLNLCALIVRVMALAVKIFNNFRQDAQGTLRK